MWGPNEAHLSMIPWSILSSGSFAMMFKVTSIESCFNLFCPRRTCWSWGAGNFKGRVIILHNFAISSQRLRHAQRLGMTAHILRDSLGSYIGKVSLAGWDTTSCDSFRQPYRTYKECFILLQHQLLWKTVIGTCLCFPKTVTNKHCSQISPLEIVMTPQMKCYDTRMSRNGCNIFNYWSALQ